MTSLLDEVVEWLGERDSHTAYGVDVLDALADMGVDVATDFRSDNNPVAVIRGPKGNGHILGIPGKEFARQATAARRHPTGPISVGEGAEQEPMLFGGWVLAGALALAFTGKRSESNGRGTAFRENLTLLRAEQAGQ